MKSMKIEVLEMRFDITAEVSRFAIKVVPAGKCTKYENRIFSFSYNTGPLSQDDLVTAFEKIIKEIQSMGRLNEQPEINEKI